MKKLLCATVLSASCAVFGAGASAPNAISFEGYTSATTLQLVNGVNEYDEDGTQESFPYFFFEGTADASIVKTFGGDNLAALRAYTSALCNMEKLEICPYHPLGLEKCATFGLAPRYAEKALPTSADLARWRQLLCC